MPTVPPMHNKHNKPNKLNKQITAQQAERPKQR